MVAAPAARARTPSCAWFDQKSRLPRWMPPKVVRVYSESGDYQLVQALRDNRNKRQKQREFFVESVACLNALRGSDWQVSTFLYCDEALSDWARELLASVDAERHLVLTPELMH